MFVKFAFRLPIVTVVPEMLQTVMPDNRYLFRRDTSKQTYWYLESEHNRLTVFFRHHGRWSAYSNCVALGATIELTVPSVFNFKVSPSLIAPEAVAVMLGLGLIVVQLVVPLPLV